MASEKIRRAVEKRKKKRDRADGDVFADYLYDRAKNGLFGAAMTSYKRHSRRGGQKGAAGRFAESSASYLSKKINSSFIVSSSGAAVKSFLSLKLKAYGTFLAAFGLYTMMFYFTENFLLSDSKGVFEMLFGAALFIISLPLIFSEQTLSSALCTSSFGAAVKRFIGIHTDSMKTDEVRCRLNYSFILGVLAGILSYGVGPFKVFFSILFVLALWIIASRPEFGVVLISFLVPFVSTAMLITLLSFTAFFFIIKLIRSKRYVSFEMLDVSVLGLLFVIFFGGIVSVYPVSFKSAAVYSCLIFAYFLTVNLMKSRVWLDRMTAALITGFAFACAVLVFAALGDRMLGGVSVKIAGMFGDSALSEMLAGGENVFPQISVILLPIALSFFMRPSFGASKLHAVLAALLASYPLFRGGVTTATAAAAVGCALLLLIYSKKFLYVLFASVILLPSAAYVFPNTFLKIASFIGAEGGVTENGFAVWRGVSDMISEFFFGGVGFGKEAWSAAYQKFAQSGGEGAPHAFSLYFQTWAETGVFGLIILLVFLAVFARCVFTVIAELDSASRHPALRHSGLRVNMPDSLDEFRAFVSEGKGNAGKLSVGQFRMSGRIGIAAPFCGVAAAALLGIFDSIWYSEKVFLVFWLAAALGASYARTVSGEVGDILSSYEENSDSACRFDADVG